MAEIHLPEFSKTYFQSLEAKVGDQAVEIVKMQAMLLALQALHEETLEAAEAYESASKASEEELV